MRDAWEVTHPLDGGGEKRKAARTVCGQAAGDPVDGCATSGEVVETISSSRDLGPLATSGTPRAGLQEAFGDLGSGA